MLKFARAHIWLVIIGALLVVMTAWVLRSSIANRRIQLISPKLGPIVESVFGLGRVESERKFEVKLGVVSSIKNVYVTEGDHVEKNSPLVDFSEGPRFRSPFAGTVTLVAFNQGETVTPHAVVMRVEDLTDRYLEVSLEQQGALRVKAGQTALVSFESIRGIRFKGKVKSIFPSQGEFLVHIDVEKLPPEILPGMTADVAIEVAEKENALLIPVAALANGRALVVRDGKRRAVDLEIGVVDGEWAEVLSGDITAQDQVVVRSQ